MLLRSSNQHGSYLIWESESRFRGPYSLSIRYHSSVVHYSIYMYQPNQGVYISEWRMFGSLADLVAYYEKVADGLCVNLKKPCMRADGTSHITCDLWEISHSSVTLVHKLGQGMFSEVFEGLWNTNTLVAVKTVKVGNTTRGAFLEKAHIMKKLRHPKVIQLYAVCTINEPFYIVTELMNNGSLRDYLRSEGRTLRMPQLIDIAAQTAAGMDYLGTQSYVHRDLMARNVLVDDSFIQAPIVAKVGGFGLAGVLVDDVYNAHPGTMIPAMWTAPEAAIYNIWSIKSDVWSFGILLTELVTFGSEPYPGMTPGEVLAQVQQGYQIPQPRGCPDRLYDMMLECWKAVAMERPTFKTLQRLLEVFYMEDVLGGGMPSDARGGMPSDAHTCRYYQ